MPQITIDGDPFFYREAGRGLSVVLIHGFPLDSRIWEAQVSGLSDRYRVIAPDLRGFGQSSSTRPFSMDDLCDDVHKLLAAIGALPCVLGGLSMGGYMTFSYAHRHAADLKGLMFIDTKAEADPPEAKENRVKMAEMARERGAEPVASVMMPKMFAPDVDKHRPDLARRLRQIMEECPPTTIAHACLAMKDRPDHRERLGQIKLPTLAISGEHDILTPPKIMQPIVDGIPGAKMAVIKGAGHLAPMEQPVQVNRAMREFLSTIK